MKLSIAPRHFMVAISRKRSVTLMSMALAMPTAQTPKLTTISHSVRREKAKPQYPRVSSPASRASTSARLSCRSRAEAAWAIASADSLVGCTR